MNSVNLFGRLAKDPEIRVTQSGKHMCTFVVAVDRRRRSDEESDADFISCTAWEATADFLKAYARKGWQIAVNGRLRVAKYTNAEGIDSWKTDVIVNDVNLVFPPKESSTRVESDYGEVRYGTPHQPHQSSRVGAAGRDIDLYSDSAVNPDDLPF